MKLDTNINHVTDHCWKGVQGQRSVGNSIIVKRKLEMTDRKQLTSYTAHYGYKMNYEIDSE